MATFDYGLTCLGAEPENTQCRRDPNEVLLGSFEMTGGILDLRASAVEPSAVEPAEYDYTLGSGPSRAIDWPHWTEWLIYVGLLVVVALGVGSAWL